jgi:hypothetical protein
MSQQYALAAGHNNAANLITLSKTNVGGKPSSCAAQGATDRVSLIVNLAGGLAPLGFASETWLVSVLLYAQYEWLRATFCSGGYSGRVTVQDAHGWARLRELQRDIARARLR